MTSERRELQILADEVRTCILCDLCTTRTLAVPGEGPDDAEVMFIGEAPGFNEDKRGEPFVGQAGGLLNELIESIGFQRCDVYITNIVKCRPPQNRDPQPVEIAACSPYLERQIALVRPKVVVTLGRFSMARFFPGAMISRIHGQPRRLGSTFYFPMYHPAAALRQAHLLQVIKADMLKVRPLIEEARRDSPEETDDRRIATEDSRTSAAAKQLNLFN